MKNNRSIKYLLGALVLVVLLLFGMNADTEKEEVFEDDEGIKIAEEAGTPTPAPTCVPEKKETVTAFVCGSVLTPGVYSLEEGSRVVDAVKEAGGFSEDAQSDYINLAQILTDGVKVYIPSLDEDPEEAASFGPNGPYNGMPDPGSKININTATKEELMTLKGVGEAKAESIISYRNDVGAFLKIEDIMNIPGIKEGLFNKIKDDITV